MRATRDYFASINGRLMCGLAAIALFAAGAIALTSMNNGYVITLLVLVLIVASIVLVGTTLSRFPGAAVILILALPVVGVFYFAAVYAVMPTAGPGLGIAAMVAGLIPAYIALRPTATDRRTQDFAPIRSAA